MSIMFSGVNEVNLQYGTLTRTCIDYRDTTRIQLHLQLTYTILTKSQHDLPTQQIVTIGNIKIGLIHGHTLIPWGDTEILADKAMMMDVDVLVYGNTLK